MICFSPDGLRLRPFVFDGVEIGAVWGKELEVMSCVADGLFDIVALVERGVVHDQRGARREFRDQVLSDPAVEDIGVDVGVEQADGEHDPSRKRADNIGAASCMPVMSSEAALPPGRVAMGARHVPGEAAFVDIDDGLALSFQRRDLFAEDAAQLRVRLRMAQNFF